MSSKILDYIKHNHVEYELPLGNDYGTMIRQYV